MYVEVKNGRFSIVFMLLCLMLSILSGCSRYKEIEITGGRIDGVSMIGLRSFNLALTVGIDNPAGKLDVREADGELIHFGKVIGKVTLNPFIVNEKSKCDHKLTAKVELSPEVGLRELMGFMDVNKIYECTVDIHVKGYVAGIPVKKNIKEIPLKELLER